MSKVLREFGYVKYRQTNPDSGLGEEIRRAVTSSDTSVLVVHVVAHGTLAQSGEGGLYVVGSDGSTLDDPVSSWISLIESHPGKQRPLTLFILDLCHSGAAATLPWHQEMPTGRRRAWVISATSRQDKAFDYRLSRATTTVLQQYLDGTLRVDPSYRHIPLPTVGHEISRAVAELNAAEGYTQQIEVSRVPFTDHTQLDDLPFFPNPWHHRRASVLSEVHSGLTSLLDETFDSRHFMLRGAGTEPLDRGLGQGYFRGRETEVRTLTHWLNGQGPGFRIVTGKPGVGKSALLGVLVCAAHPTLRTPTQPLWFVLPAKPAHNDRLIVVHARRRGLEQIANSLARQMGATKEDCPAGGWDAQSLTRLAHAGTGTAYTLVIDALDEAERPDDVAQALLLPLARSALTADTGLRLLIGTRSEPRFAALLQLAQEAGGLINLDDAVPCDVHRALRQYVADLLAVDTPYAARDAAEAANALAEGIAARLTGINDPARDEVHVPDGTRPLGWGEFLVAGLYLQRVLDLPTERDPDLARQLGRAVPLGLAELLELDLARRTDRPHLRPTLAALAHAKGLGMPERVVAHVAAAFAPSQVGSGPLPHTAVRRALAQARFYLRRDIDVNGTTLYRLFHEGLAERLRADPYGSPAQEQTS
ncbi:AAA family ATPase [Streptomyces lydicus]|uniref:AAA family ATPase n=1 Tax=Streptomyces lydicus TaxID=47763 RepID=UPI00378A0A15